MTTERKPDDVEMPGQLDLLDEIPGETRGTKKCRSGRGDNDDDISEDSRQVRG